MERWLEPGTPDRMWTQFRGSANRGGGGSDNRGQQIFNDWGNEGWSAVIGLEFDFFGPWLAKQITCSV